MIQKSLLSQISLVLIDTKSFMLSKTKQNKTKQNITYFSEPLTGVIGPNHVIPLFRLNDLITWLHIKDGSMYLIPVKKPDFPFYNLEMKLSVCVIRFSQGANRIKYRLGTGYCVQFNPYGDWDSGSGFGTELSSIQKYITTCQ